jgi:hypothetical protein
MISHLRNKPEKEKILEIMTQCEKLEFEFLRDGINVHLIQVSPSEIAQVLTKKRAKILENI